MLGNRYTVPGIRDNHIVLTYGPLIDKGKSLIVFTGTARPGL